MGTHFLSERCLSLESVLVRKRCASMVNSNCNALTPLVCGARASFRCGVSPWNLFWSRNDVLLWSIRIAMLSFPSPVVHAKPFVVVPLLGISFGSETTCFYGQFELQCSHSPRLWCTRITGSNERHHNERVRVTLWNRRGE